jgi:L,D-peptidoglycan transpeptidase YkuD (ErfK/YbiS/YcfS/YnhG family)
MSKVPAGSRQAIVVDGASMNTTYARLSAYQRTTDGGWHRVLGPVPARIGSAGFSWDHREGVPATAIGVFTLPLAFGWADPGTKMAWRTATTDSMWVDDPTSAYYDTWQTAPANGRWVSAEQLHISLYQWAVWININPNHTPYAGSAVFLHLLGAGSTAGCVSVDQTSLLWLLGWLDPAAQPRMVIGPDSVLNQ